MFLEHLKRLYNKILDIGIDKVSDSEEQSRIRIMNYWQFIGVAITFMSMMIGLFLDFFGYFLPSFIAFLLIFFAYYLTNIGHYKTGWYLILGVPTLVISTLPAFVEQIFPACLVFFIVFQTIVFILFSDRRILFSFLAYYSICAIMCCYFLFGSYSYKQNFNIDLIGNVVNLVFGLILQFNALFLLQREREKSRASLLESEAKFRSIFEENPLGILLSSAKDFKNKEVNWRYQEMFGYCNEEVKTMNTAQLTYEEDQNVDYPSIQKLMIGETRYVEFEKRYVRKDKSVFWAKTSVALVRDSRGEPIYNIAMLQDISKSKEQEKRIQELLHDLTKLNADLEQKIKERTANLLKTNEELKQSNEDLEQFAYVASHDLQEPLRMIGNFVQLLERRYGDKIDEAGKEYIQFAVEGVTRMSALIKGLLEYSRVGRKELGLQAANLNIIVAEKLRDVEQLIKEKNAEVTMSYLPDSIICEPLQIGIVFYNLVVNGLKFNNKSKSQIFIQHTEDEAYYTFSVADNGIGIQLDYQQKVFEIFKRLNNREAYEGNGIGLALCKKIVLRHGGKIWFESEMEKGTTFYFTISKMLK